MDGDVIDRRDNPQIAAVQVGNRAPDPPAVPVLGFGANSVFDRIHAPRSASSKRAASPFTRLNSGQVPMKQLSSLDDKTSLAYRSALFIKAQSPPIDDAHGDGRAWGLMDERLDAGAPRSRPSTLTSSSISGQWIPYPAPAIWKRLSCSGVACKSRGNHASGAQIVRPSASAAQTESCVHDTFTIRSPAVAIFRCLNPYRRAGRPCPWL